MNENRSTGQQKGKCSRQCRNKNRLPRKSKHAMIIAPSKGTDLRHNCAEDDSRNHQRAMERICLLKSATQLSVTTQRKPAQCCTECGHCPQSGHQLNSFTAKLAGAAAASHALSAGTAGAGMLLGVSPSFPSACSWQCRSVAKPLSKISW